MANGEDYNNFFSGDYWTPEGYKKRKAGERQGSAERARIQNQNRANEWKNIGDFLNPVKTHREAIAKGAGAAFKGAAIAKGVYDGLRQGPTESRRKPPKVGYEIGNISSEPTLSSQPRYANKMLSDEAARGSGSGGLQSSETSFFDELLGKITSDWSGIDKSKVDYSPLDAALNARMGALNNLRGQTQGNFDKSDMALEGMHKAQQDRMNTEGVSRYNQIADTQKANLQASSQTAQDNIQKMKAEDLAKRQAMLENLGLPANELDAAPDEILGQAQTSIASRTDANTTSADANRGTNLAFNQGMINSVGQQGVERRAELGQQLQAILGRIGMAEADAQAENANARYQLEQNEGDRQYNQWQNNRGFLQDTLGMMQDDALKREEMAMQGSDPAEIGGFAGLGQDLLNAGYDVPQIQEAMGTLSEVVSGDYRKGIDPNAGYGQTDILMRRLREAGVDPMLAFQLATNYGNLGNTSKYTASPY